MNLSVFLNNVNSCTAIFSKCDKEYLTELIRLNNVVQSDKDTICIDIKIDNLIRLIKNKLTNDYRSRELLSEPSKLENHLREDFAHLTGNDDLINDIIDVLKFNKLV